MLKPVSITALSCLLASSLSFAAETTSDTAKSMPTQMSKDDWLGQMNPMLPDLICKGFLHDRNLKKRFEELKLTYDLCLTQIPDISKKCQDDVYTNIPKMVNSESTATWGRKIGECIGKSYAETYLIPK
ncbi:MAG: hypothetical protein ACHP6H_04840 [Legionellales bacterium]